VLRYRLPADEWRAGPDAPVHDALRALRVLRARQTAAPGKMGIIGFSAGGHLVARLITEPTLDYAHVDKSDALTVRPDFAVLMYPVIATTGPAAHAPSMLQLRAAAGIPTGTLERYSPDLHVDARTPPTLLVHAADDDVVPVDNSILMWQALRKAGVRSELHVFDRGGHGFGMRGIAGKNVAAWPSLVESWAREASAN
jgi:dipeptidyl aminopeptidase/acylaminoacyl peptidase